MEQIKFSEDLLNQFIQLNSELTDNAFQMGDLAVNVVDEYSHLYKHADILRALADQTGSQYDTLRDRERVARATPLQARAEYPLSFHQWRSCIRVGIDPVSVAAWAVSGDKIATVREIQLYVQGKDDIPDWVRPWERMKASAEILLLLDDTPADKLEVATLIQSVE